MEKVKNRKSTKASQNLNYIIIKSLALLYSYLSYLLDSIIFSTLELNVFLRADMTIYKVFSGDDIIKADDGNDILAGGDPANNYFGNDVLCVVAATPITEEKKMIY
ncbi:MAG: hypothetical protein M3O24_02540 [Thermoproteota archaeon]|nr:hypothetical protein [Thermoproteota archaeon]